PSLSPAPDSSDRPVTVTVQVTLEGPDALASAARFAEHLRLLAESSAADGGRVAAVTTTLVVGDAPPPPAAASAAGSAAVAAPRARLSPARRDLYVDDALVPLTRLEFDLLLLLASHPGRVFSREQLLRTVWGHAVVCGQRTVDVHV